MTKDRYFELCEALGTEPIDSEIPVDFEDFPAEVQRAFSMYNMLKDNWDSMGGGYLGKDISMLFNIFDLYEIEKPDKLFIISMIQHMDIIRGKIISDKIKANKNAPPKD